MKILVIGGTRGIGKELIHLLIEEHFEVTVLVRNPVKVTLENPHLRIIQGDVRDAVKVSEVARGQDGICSSIGVPITFKPVDLFSTAAANLTAAVKENPGQKLVVVTGIGAGDSKGHGGFLYDAIFKPLLLRTIYEDKDREEALIQESGVEWLLVRPAGLTNGIRTGNYRVINDLSGVVAKRISRLDVADFIVKQLKDSTHFGQTPLITY